MKLLIDSMCDLSEAYRNHPKLDMVSLNVIIEGKVYRDKRDINLEQMNEFMRQDIVPTSSQVTPSDFYDYFEAYAKKGQACLYLAFSSKLSGSYATGQLVLKDVKHKYPDFQCEIVDSRQSGGGIALIAERLLDAMDEGKKLEELVTMAEKIIPHTRFFFSIEDLNWLYRGGRISKGTAVVGGFLKIHPIVSVEEGELKIVGKFRGSKKAQKKIIEMVSEEIVDNLDQRVGIAYTGAMKAVDEYREALVTMGVKRIEPVPIGCVLAAHLGLQGTGIYFLDTPLGKILNN